MNEKIIEIHKTVNIYHVSIKQFKNNRILNEMFREML